MMGKVESNHFLQIPPQPVICKLSPASRVEDRNGSLNVFLITSKGGTAAQSGGLSANQTASKLWEAQSETGK